MGRRMDAREGTQTQQSPTARLARVGRRIGVDSLVESPLAFRLYHRLALQNAPGLATALTRQFPTAHRWVDVGAGSGALAAELARRGLDVVACERARVGRLLASWQGVRSVPLDLERPEPARLAGPFDVACCFEVGQQLSEPLGERLVAFVASAAPIAVFSSGQPGQGGVEPVNLQPPAYWVERFAAVGMRLDVYTTAALATAIRAERVPGDWLAANVLAFRR